MIKTRIFSLALALTILCSGCTEPGETTGVAAATGGVIGAGLGAIVGNQTGDPGAGLVIGAAAGAAGGAMVGNALESQEKSIRAQDEAIERQERTIAAQRAELEELRRMGQDNVSVKGRLNSSLNPRGASPTANNRAFVQGKNTQMARVAPLGTTRSSGSSVSEKTIPAPVVQGMGGQITAPTLGSANREKTYSENLYGSMNASSPKVQEVNSEIKVRPTEGTIAKANTTDSNSNSSTECLQAEQENNKAKLATEASDKLFHYRRAIRLCPRNPEHHNGLGETYLSLKRQDDARFEFQEALNMDPSYEPARKNLASTKEGSDRY